MLAIPNSIQPIVDSEADDSTEPDAVTLSPDRSDWLQEQALPPGPWLEFSLTEDNLTRAKLSWISPMSGRYLFVNRRGLKVADYSPQDLAILLADGQARVLAANALFDRAMTAIVDKLSQPDTTPTATNTGADAE